MLGVALPLVVAAAVAEVPTPPTTGTAVIVAPDGRPNRGAKARGTGSEVERDPSLHRVANK